MTSRPCKLPEVPCVLEECARSLDKVFLTAAVVAAAAAALALCVEWKSIKKDEKMNEEEKLDVYLDSRKITSRVRFKELNCVANHKSPL